MPRSTHSRPPAALRSFALPAARVFAALGLVGILIDAQGLLQHHVSTLTMNLSLAANATTLDGWVRALLP